MNGYELASRILSENNFESSPLLDLTGKQEGDWLEFKAALFPDHTNSNPSSGSSKTETSKENEVDYFWHVAKAVIAMANSHGGVILLGVSDHGEPVDSRFFDPHGYLESSTDTYFRHTLAKAIIPESRQWATGTRGIWRVEQSHSHLVDMRSATLNGKPIIAMLVHPIPLESKLLKCVELVNGRQHRSVVFTRQSGQIGRVRELIDHDLINEYSSLRKNDHPIFESLYRNYVTSKSPAHDKRQEEATLDSFTADILSRLPASQMVKLLSGQKHTLKISVEFSGDQSDRVKDPAQPQPKTGYNVSVSNEAEQKTNEAHDAVAAVKENLIEPNIDDNHLLPSIKLDASFINTYKIFVDTDSLIHPSASQFFDASLTKLLRNHDQKILISERTIDFLSSSAAHPNTHAAQAATGALDILSTLQNNGCVADCKDPYSIAGGKYSTDTLYLELFVKYQLERALCLITQNQVLAKRIWKNATSAAFNRTKPVVLLFLDSQGKPRPWFQTDITVENKTEAPVSRQKTLIEDISENYKILADTSSLMLHDDRKDKFLGRDFFLDNLLYCLKTHNNSLLVPLHVTKEIQRHKGSRNSLLAKQANLAEQTLHTYLKEGVLDISNEEDETSSGKAFADQVFVRIAIRFATMRNLCFITQDRELAKLLIANGEAVAASSEYELKVIYIDNRSGKIQDWIPRLKREADNPPPPRADNSNNIRQSHGSSLNRVKEIKVTESETKTAPTIISPKQKIISFDVHRKPFVVDQTVLSCSNFPVEGNLVFSEKFGAINLTSQISEGGEGIIYKTSNHELVCKIYHPECLTKERQDKLELMLSQEVNIKGVCWPVDIVKNDKRQFVGFLMPKAEGKVLKLAVFAKPLLIKNFPHWNRTHLLKLAMTILNAYNSLHKLNVFVGDINPQNIMVLNENTVYIVDTDSFQVEGFPCPVGTDTFTPANLQGKNFRSFLRTEEDELFAVTTLLFMILFPGKAPYSSQGGGEIRENIKNHLFPYGRQDADNRVNAPDGVWKFIWTHLHPRLRTNFEQVFKDNKRVSIKDLQVGLQAMLQDIKSGKRSDEIFPTQPKLVEGKTVSLVCSICGEAAEVNERTAEKLASSGKPFKHDQCRSLRKMQFLETTRETSCAICGKREPASINHLENLRSSGRDYWCNSCQDEKGRGNRTFNTGTGFSTRSSANNSLRGTQKSYQNKGKNNYNQQNNNSNNAWSIIIVAAIALTLLIMMLN